jgi:quercetin dioxygenase-like cupin family protein
MDRPKPIRRIVTGHDHNGVAKVLMDAPATNIRRGTHGNVSTTLWTTTRTPTDIALGEAFEDGGARKVGTQPPPGGNRFNINELPPGRPGVMHRTESLDYAVILEGEVDMELDAGERISLNPGDVVIQRGTNHAWINRGTTWARILFVLVDAEPLGIGHPVPYGSFPGNDKG